MRIVTCGYDIKQQVKRVAKCTYREDEECNWGIYLSEIFHRRFNECATVAKCTVK